MVIFSNRGNLEELGNLVIDEKKVPSKYQCMACRVCHCQNLQINPVYGQVGFGAVWTNHIAMKNCFQQQDKDCIAKS